MPTEDHEDNIEQPSSLKQHLTLINLVLIIILAIALIIAIKTRPDLKPQLQQVTQKTSALQINQAANQKALQEETSLQQQKLQQLQLNVIALMKDSTLSDRNRELDIIKNLIYQAQYTMQLNSNLDRTLQLIELANNKIEKLNEPDLLELGADLNDIISQIKASQQNFQMGKTIQTIDSIRTLTQQLPNSPEKSFIKPVVHTTQSKGKHWYSNIKTILCGFKNLVIIRHHTQPISPLLTDNQVQIIKNNIALELNQAQSALLSRDQKLFSTSMVNTSKQIQRLPKQQATADILKMITPLNTLNINPKRPSLSDAIVAINKLTANANHTHKPSKQGH
jgi:uroporphyrin-III C-methyltransferase